VTTETLTIRLFAAAREAAGTAQTSLTAAEPAWTVGEVIDRLVARYGGRDGQFARVAARCSFLVDGQQARRHVPVGDATMLDVLPPFAGG
jgi:molybdopterin synthase sulfur carrier subunit